MNANYTTHARQAVSEARKIVERQILKTPTGNARNALTDANIHLMAAEKALNDALSANKVAKA